MSLFAIRTDGDPGAATFQGRLIVHDNRDEMRFLFPLSEIIDVSSTTYPTMSVKDHPMCSTLSWPLNREEFR